MKNLLTVSLCAKYNVKQILLQNMMTFLILQIKLLRQYMSQIILIRIIWRFKLFNYWWKRFKHSLPTLFQIGENIQIISHKKYKSENSIFINYLHNKYNLFVLKLLQLLKFYKRYREGYKHLRWFKGNCYASFCHETDGFRWELLDIKVL